MLVPVKSPTSLPFWIPVNVNVPEVALIVVLPLRTIIRRLPVPPEAFRFIATEPVVVSEPEMFNAIPLVFAPLADSVKVPPEALRAAVPAMVMAVEPDAYPYRVPLPVTVPLIDVAPAVGLLMAALLDSDKVAPEATVTPEVLA